MNWFYLTDGRQNGPVTDTQLDELLRVHKITVHTSVWHEGLADWQPLLAARPAVPPPLPAGQSTVRCSECGRDFPPDEVVVLNKTPVCAGCKPAFLQRLREGAAPSAAGLWRTGKQLVTRSEISFPDRCVKCNAPAQGFRLKRKLSWHPSLYYLLILVNLIIYVIIAAIISKKAVVHVGLCQTHRTRRIRGIILCCLGVFGGLGMIIGAVVISRWSLALAGLLALVGGPIFGVITGAGISAAKITNENVWIKGVSKNFLAELPEWTGP